MRPCQRPQPNRPLLRRRERQSCAWAPSSSSCSSCSRSYGGWGYGGRYRRRWCTGDCRDCCGWYWCCDCDRGWSAEAAADGDHGGDELGFTVGEGRCEGLRCGGGGGDGVCGVGSWSAAASVREGGSVSGLGSCLWGQVGLRKSGCGGAEGDGGRLHSLRGYGCDGEGEEKE